MTGELITQSFAIQCAAFPARVDAMLAEIQTVEQAKGMLDQADTMQHYAQRLKAGIEVERPIALGVLKIKAKLGELMPATPPKERGRGKKKENTKPDLVFSAPVISAFRKLAANKDKLEEYYEKTEDVPTQGDFLKFVTAPHVSNNSIENEWYTPPEWIEAARKAMGGIDLDPASCEIAQDHVKAKKYFTIEDDGLSKVWRGRVWMNPPYSRDTCAKFVERLVFYYREDAIKQACVLVNNATDTAWLQELLSVAAAVCFPSGRISFLDKTGKPANKPLQGQAVVYLGENLDGFVEAFKDRGVVLFGANPSTAACGDTA